MHLTQKRAPQRIENPDTVAEFRLITNQFLAEYGRTAGAVVNIMTKSGTNTLHGTAYWTNNNNHFNSLSNLNKQAGLRSRSSPYSLSPVSAAQFQVR